MEIDFELKLSQEKLKSFLNICNLLNKVGKDLLIEIDNNEVCLRALNDAKSAFISVSFTRDLTGQSYFESIYSNKPSFSCKILLKAICNILKNIRNVMSLSIIGSSNQSDNKIIFEMILSNNIKRVYKYIYSNCQIVSAVFDDQNPLLSYIQCDPKLFIQLLDHIHYTYELCITLNNRLFYLKSYQSQLNKDSIGTGLMSRSIANSQSVSISDLISRKTMITGVNVNIEEFDIYEYKGVYSTTSQSGNNNDNVDELIFCIKEFKAMLLFCESLNINDFRFWFINAGCPVKMSCKNSLGFEVNLIMSTLAPRIVNNTNSQLDSSTHDMLYNNKNNENDKSINNDEQWDDNVYEDKPLYSKLSDNLSKFLVNSQDSNSNMNKSIDLAYLSNHIITSPLSNEVITNNNNTTAKKRRIIESQEDNENNIDK